jgi:hypothetical protein
MFNWTFASRDFNLSVHLAAQKPGINHNKYYNDVLLCCRNMACYSFTANQK